MPSDPTEVRSGRATSSGRSRAYWVPAIVALVVLLAIGLFVGAGDLNHQPPKSLTGAEVADQIALAIQDQQHRTAPPPVRCPATEPVRAGWHFTCTETSGGQSKTVRVVEIDGRGGLSWSLSPP
jgi:hypothetical protein